jgi:hypothetical protein
MRKRIGEYLVERGILLPDQVEQILAFGRTSGLRFGEAGMELGLLNRQAMIDAFGKSYLIDFFHLDSRYFPQVTRDLLPVEAIVRFGALPLGYKTVPGLFRSRKLLNLGLLDPARQDVVDAVTEVVRPVVGEALAGVKTYLVLASDFVPLVDKVFALSPAALAELPSEKVDPTLKMFLDS